MRFYIFLLFTFLTAELHCQSFIISGYVSDTMNRPIPYVNIGLSELNIGTISNYEGNFDLKVPDTVRSGKLLFSHVGYEVESINLNAIHDTIHQITLIQSERLLSEITIDAKKSKQRSRGSKIRNPILYGNVKPSNQLDIVEFAKRFNINEPILLKKAAIYLKHVELDTATIRLNIYSVENDDPGERLTKKEVLMTSKVDKGWFEFDLSKFEIEVNEDFFLGFEYLPKSQVITSRSINYGAKLGGSLYTRNTSLGNWTKIEGVTLTAYLDFWE